MSLRAKTIGQVAEELSISAHTLRYYEKIDLLPSVSKSSSGRREYHERDIERIQFIKRAQRMHFSLAEIRSLIQLGSAMDVDKPLVQELVQEKLSEIETSLKDLKQLQHDLGELLKACKGSATDEECPIIAGFQNE